MRLRIGISARFAGTIEVDVPEEEIEFRGGPDAWAKRNAEDLASRVLDTVPELDVEVEDLDRFDEGDGNWAVVPEPRA